MPPAAQNSEAAILASLVGWSADCPSWQRDALRRLCTDDTLSDTDIDALLSICKGEMAAAPLSADHVRDPAAAGAVVTLRRLHDVQHVNALTSDAELSFDRAGLTVIYGDNGSGKSGYARILKNACRARVTGRENILANIYEANPGEPAAVIDFTVNGQNRTAPWAYGTPADPMLSAVSVFDARTANVHVDQANDLAYTPTPLRILAALAQACRTLHQRLDAEVATLQKQVPEAISNPSCQPDTAVGKLLANLGAPGAAEAVEELATLSEAERERLNQLTADLAADPARVSRQLLTLKTKVEGYILRLEHLEHATGDETAQELRSTASAYAAARAAANAASTTLFAKEPLPLIGSETWRGLWESARRYSEREAYAGQTFPVVDSPAVCVLCQQELAPEAAARLSRFETFIKDDSKQREGEAKAAYDASLAAFQATRISSEDVDAIVACVADELPDALLAVSLREAIQRQLERFEQIERDHATEVAPTYASVAPLPLEALRTHVAELEKRAASLSAEAGSEARKALVAERDELADRQWLGTIKADAVAQIGRLKKISGLQVAAQDTGTTRITTKSTEVAGTLVTNALRAQFAREVDRLGVASLAIELKQERSAYGIPRFKVALTRKPDASVGDVLSEGEHRSVALAAFLAELATIDAKSAIVFDDPISSLDHMHREAVAKRLVDEALQRQVIVFTHDIAFLFLLDQARDDLDPAPHFAIRSVSRGRDYAGFCNPEPPFNARPLTDIIEAMGRRLDAEKINFDRGNQPEWEKTVRSLQEQLRESWERAVEDALSPVLKRLSNKVATGGLSKVTAITLADCETMRAAFGRCSALLHSEAAGLNTPLPTPEAMKAEIVALGEWVNSIRGRQRVIDFI
jgi:energy-coupling factor transporter ATP-binding protein EcfA2